ncbi:MAG TPA: class I SAM-dependent methyltransferase [Acetobacteraceae bacterium]|nr:class I SAM-dependent methyltransferase [Acetobacteraceae bacterium]
MVELDSAFPNMIVGDTGSNQWPYLRREIGHNWYVDRRNPTVGFLSRDEAMLLHNIALLHAGRPCLEIGCWRGWSTAHMALGSGNLEVIDPVLADPDFREDVSASLRRAGVLDRVVLHTAPSPGAIADLSEGTGKRWSLIFIDGDHEGDAPRLDAETAHRYAADNATIVLHDLSSPHVAAALFWLRDHGWRTAIYQTMQIMGIAVRGSDRAPSHQPDPSQRWTVPEHLVDMPVVGEPRGARIARLLASLDGNATPPDWDGNGALDQLPEEAAAAVDALLSRLAARGAAPAGLAEAFDALQARYTALTDRLAAMEANPTGPEPFERLQAEHVRLLGRLADLESLEAGVRAELAAAQDALQAARSEAAAEAERARTVAVERDMATGLLDRLQVKHVQLLERMGDLEGREAELQQAPPAALPAAGHNPRLAIEEAACWLARSRTLFGLSRRVLAGRGAEARQLVEDALHRAGLPEATISRAAHLGTPRVVLGLARRRLLAGMQAVQGVVILELERAAGPDLWAGLAQPGAGVEAGAQDRMVRDLEERLAVAEQRFAALEAEKLRDEQALLQADLALARLRAQLAGKVA